MTPDEILKAFDNIRVWQRGEKPRAEFPEIERTGASASCAVKIV